MFSLILSNLLWKIFNINIKEMADLKVLRKARELKRIKIVVLEHI